MVICMLRNTCDALAVSLITACATLDEGTEPKLFPLDIGEFKKISITEAGIKSIAGKDLDIYCGNFILSLKEIWKNILNEQKEFIKVTIDTCLTGLHAMLEEK